MTFKALITEKTDDGYQSRVGDKNLEDLPEGDVLVRVAWSSLNYKDALSAGGAARRPTPPRACAANSLRDVLFR